MLNLPRNNMPPTLRSRQPASAPPPPLQSAAKFGTSTFAFSGDPNRTGWRDDFSGLFKDKRGKLKAPNSCIESAEFIIQSIARKKRSFPQKNYVAGQVNVPHVVSHFETEIVNATIKNKKPEEVRNALQNTTGVVINISTSENLR
jgi:hypothetical protein